MLKIRLALFNDRAAAKPILEHLLQAGIPAQIHDEPWLVRRWHTWRKTRGKTVHLCGVKLLLGWLASLTAFASPILAAEPGGNPVLSRTAAGEGSAPSESPTCLRDVLPILEATYGLADARRWFHRWRMFFLAVAETFGFANGTEWFVSHSLLQRNGA